MKLYYCEKYDILCIVENGKVYKYIGELQDLDNIISFKFLGFPINEWYKSDNYPNRFFKLIKE